MVMLCFVHALIAYDVPETLVAYVCVQNFDFASAAYVDATKKLQIWIYGHRLSQVKQIGKNEEAQDNQLI